MKWKNRKIEKMIELVGIGLRTLKLVFEILRRIEII